jgi:hypothetical protein
MKWIKISILAASLGALYFWWTCTYSYRYRITVEVEADGRILSGSGEIETRWMWLPPALFNSQWHPTTSGEAPIIDLGQRGTLVATFEPSVPHNKCNPESWHLFYAPIFAERDFIARRDPSQDPAVRDVRRFSIDERQTFAFLRTLKEPYHLRINQLPQFVWFSDRADRLSAKIVCPADLNATIHPTVRIRSVTMEMTSDVPVGTIYAKVPWLKSRQIEENKSPQIKSHRQFEINSFDLLGAAQ